MIIVTKIFKEFGTETGIKKTILKDVSFQIQSEKITSVIAARNSGLTTLLKIISDLEPYSSGEIVNASNGKIIYLPSEPTSFPWLNVYDNIVFGQDNFSKDEILKLIKLVGLEGYEKFHPHNNSLGFRFRISLARSLANKPALILIDDCFRLMDQQTKIEIYSLIKNVNQTEKVTCLVASTNITEALILSDKIYVMKKDPGEIISHFDIRKFDFSEMDSPEFISFRIQILNAMKKNTSQNLSGISI